ncbi:MAG: hypothetical protein JW958_02925 [Candidatus Eisenbacteria bacterium]|nr:hypothetical protein [Candidatus Eisenbacteria bacterium]
MGGAGGDKYEQVTGDTTYRSYVDSCASYLATHNLSRPGTTGFYDLVNPPVLAWGAGNLYAYGEAREDSVWKYRGWKRANRVKGWVDSDPAIMSNEEWAVSGGAVAWGLLESYFRVNVGEESLWVETYATLMDTVADPGDWENAANGWYALGHKRVQRSTGDPYWGARHQWLTDYLLAFDTDDDGGIQGNPADTDTMDHAWIAAYLGFMCLDPLIEEDTEVALAGAGAPAAPVTLLPNRPNPFNPSTEIAFTLREPARVRLGVFDAAGRLVARVADGDYPAGRHAFFWDGRGRGGSPSPSGVYFCRLDAGRWTSTRKMVLLR